MDYTPPYSPYIYTYIDICVYISIFPVSESEFLLYLACSVVCFQWHKLSLDKVYDSIIVRGWQVLLPVAFNANIELYPFPLPPLSVSVSVPPCPVYLALFSLPFSLLLLSLVLFLSQLLLSLSLGRGNLLLLLSLSTSNHPSVYPSTNQATHQATKQPSIQLPICSISAPLCVGVGVLESCILTGQRQVLPWIILVQLQTGGKALGEGELCLWL